MLTAIALAIGRAHPELARRDDNHLRTVLGAFPERVSRLERPLGRRLKHMRREIRRDVAAQGDLLEPEVGNFILDAQKARDATEHQDADRRQQTLPWL